MGTISVDLAALRTAAQRVDSAADILAGTLGTHLRDLQSGGTAVGDLVAEIGQWTRAAREVAAALRHSVDRYCDQDSAGATALR